MGQIGKMGWEDGDLDSIPGLGRSLGEENGYPLQIGKMGWEDGDLDSIPGLGRSLGEENGYPLQYSGLESSTDCIVHGVAKSQTQLSNFHFTSLLHLIMIQF